MDKVRDTKGRWWPWNLAQCKVSRMDTTPRSSLHLSTRKILHELYPLEQKLEEVPVPGERLYIDFYIPSRRLAVEVHGEQHYKYTPHFHGHITAFMESKQRDLRKIEWCRVNGITLVTLPFSETTDDWRERIKNY